MPVRDVREIIQSLDHQGIDLGLASRTHSPETALHLLDLFGVGQFFPYRQIFPGSKTRPVIGFIQIIAQGLGMPIKSTIPMSVSYAPAQSATDLIVFNHLVQHGKQSTGGLKTELANEIGFAPLCCPWP